MIFLKPYFTIIGQKFPKATLVTEIYGLLFLTKLEPSLVIFLFCQVPGPLRAHTGHVKGPEVDVLVIAAGLHGLRALCLRDQL